MNIWGLRVKPWQVVAAAVVVTGILLLLPALPLPGDSSPGSDPRSATHEVVYEADGSGGTSSGTYTARSGDGGTVQGDADLPLTNKDGGRGLRFTGFAGGELAYLSIQNSEGYGAVTCRIKVDGVTVAENTSDGAYVIATCQARIR